MHKNILKIFMIMSFLVIVIIGFKSINLDKKTLRDMVTPLNKVYKINNLKKQTIVNSGVLEELTTKTYHSNLGYKIDFDVNLFKPERTKGLDKFTFISDEEVYFTIEPIKEKEYNLGKDAHNLIYKKVGKIFLKIKIYCPEDPDYQFGIYGKIIYLLNSIEPE